MTSATNKQINSFLRTTFKKETAQKATREAKKQLGTRSTADVRAWAAKQLAEQGKISQEQSQKVAKRAKVIKREAKEREVEARTGKDVMIGTRGDVREVPKKSVSVPLKASPAQEVLTAQRTEEPERVVVVDPLAQQSRELTPFETAGLRDTLGGQSTEQGERFVSSTVSKDISGVTEPVSFVEEAEPSEPLLTVEPSDLSLKQRFALMEGTTDKPLVKLVGGAGSFVLSQLEAAKQLALVSQRDPQALQEFGGGVLQLVTKPRETFAQIGPALEARPEKAGFEIATFVALGGAGAGFKGEKLAGSLGESTTLAKQLTGEVAIVQTGQEGKVVLGTQTIESSAGADLTKGLFPVRTEGQVGAIPGDLGVVKPAKVSGILRVEPVPVKPPTFFDRLLGRQPAVEAKVEFGFPTIKPAEGPTVIVAPEQIVAEQARLADIVAQEKAIPRELFETPAAGEKLFKGIDVGKGVPPVRDVPVGEPFVLTTKGRVGEFAKQLPGGRTLPAPPPIEEAFFFIGDDVISLKKVVQPKITKPVPVKPVVPEPVVEPVTPSGLVEPATVGFDAKTFQESFGVGGRPIVVELKTVPKPSPSPITIFPTVDLTSVSELKSGTAPVGDVSIVERSFLIPEKSVSAFDIASVVEVKDDSVLDVASAADVKDDSTFESGFSSKSVVKEDESFLFDEAVDVASDTASDLLVSSKTVAVTRRPVKRRVPKKVIPIPVVKKKRKKKEDVDKPFVAVPRVKGKDKILSRHKSASLASRRAARYVDNNASASYVVKKNDVPVNIKSVPKGFYKSGNRFIEKVANRINTPGERSQISKVGQRVQRSKSVSKKFKTRF